MSHTSARGRPRRRGGAYRRRGASGWAKAGYVVAGLGGVGALGAMLYFGEIVKPPTLDAALCPSTGPTGSTLIVLDLTDPVEPVQLLRVRTRVADVVREAKVGTLLSLALVEEDAAAQGVRFSACKPPTGEDANQWTENPRMIRERYAERFEAPLNQALGEMLGSTPANSSPIMESMQAALASSESRFASGGPGSGENRLVLVSDLLQHSPAFSFFRGDTWASFARSGGTSRLSRSLEDVEVLLLRLPRPNAKIRDRNAVDDFWVRYLEAQGNANVRTETVGDL